MEMWSQPSLNFWSWGAPRSEMPISILQSEPEIDKNRTLGLSCKLEPIAYPVEPTRRWESCCWCGNPCQEQLISAGAINLIIQSHLMLWSTSLERVILWPKWVKIMRLNRNTTSSRFFWLAENCSKKVNINCALRQQWCMDLFTHFPSGQIWRFWIRLSKVCSNFGISLSRLLISFIPALGVVQS